MKNFARLPLRLHAFLLLMLVAVSLLPAPRTNAAVQRREHLTEQETDMVRDTQELDRRISLFVKIAERRMVVLAGGAEAAPTLSAKDLEKWGELPKGTRAQLFNDLARILDEAINNIDDVAVRSPNSSHIPKAVRHLAEASARFLPQLTSLRATASGDGEREALEQALDNLQQILDASKKLPEATTEEKKGEKKKN